MKTAFLIFLSVALILSACNHSSGKNENGADRAAHSMNHDSGHQPANTTVEIPPVPPIPEGARVYFRNIRDAAVVTGDSLRVEMGIDHMKVDPAGPVLEGSGHHHLIIDAGDSLAHGSSIPKDDQHIHFGDGSTETTIHLAKGSHTLTLQFADGLHRSYGSKLSSRIRITVQ